MNDNYESFSHWGMFKTIPVIEKPANYAFNSDWTGEANRQAMRAYKARGLGNCYFDEEA